MNTPIKINEIFPSIQGEGLYTGKPAVFIRMQGCSVRCPFCDTRDSWPSNKSSTVQDVLRTVAVWLDKYPDISLIVITGGEPFEQPEALAQLYKKLVHTFNDVRIQIETSGGIDLEPFTKLDMSNPVHYMLNTLGICLSPKMAKPPADAFYVTAQTIKLLVGPDGLLSPKSVEEIVKIWRNSYKRQHLYFQPVDFGTENEIYKAKQNAVQLALQYGCNVSAQIHKYLQVK